MRLFFYFPIAALILVSGCAGQHKGPTGLDFISGNQGDLETIVILGTNDIHGGLAPVEQNSREESSTPSVKYLSGGMANLATYLRVLREEFGSRFLWLDGGDEFQGSIDSNSQKGVPMVAVFNELGLGAAAIGNHEFDFGVAELKERMTEAKYPYLAANITEKSNGKLAAFPNTLPSTILNAGHLKVGVIGLSTLETPTTTRPDFVQDYSFENLKDATVHEAQSLRKKGAHLVVIVAHVGLFCSPGKKTGHAVRKFTDPQGDCNEDGELVKFLKALPQGAADAVVAGHSHQVIYHWVAGLPVVQGGAFGRYLNLIYLTYDWGQKKVVKDRTLIEGPIPVCERVFENQGDCNGEKPAPKDGRGSLVRNYFHGRKIHPDSAIEKLLEPYFKKSEVIKKTIVGTAARAIDHQRFKESELGNLVSDAIRLEAKTDFALVNSGGLRAPLESGPLTYEAVFRSLPFDNAIATLKLTGRELKLLLRITESGSRGFAPVSGLTLKLLDTSVDASSTDLNGNGKIEPWEINRLLETKSQDGSPIKDDQTYTLGTVDFLLVGGDDFSWFMSQIPKDRVQLNTGGILRETVVKYLAQISPVNTSEKPLIDPAHLRLNFQKSKKIKKEIGHRRKRR